MYAITIDNISKRFGWFFSRRKVQALNELSLNVPDNTIFGFLGPNGAGKTTTIKILLGLILPDKGSSSIFSIPSGDRDVRERVGFLPDNPQFYPHLSASEFLQFCGKLIHLNCMERSRRADMLLERMGLKDQANQKVEGFSRGQMQRLGIAQALLNNPDLIILDEPITGLDPMGRREVKQIMTDLKDEGKTVFFSSHILSDVEQMCDMISIVNCGHLVTHGKCDDLLGTKEVEIWVEGFDSAAISEVEKFCSSVTKRGELLGFMLKKVEDKDKIVNLIKEKKGQIKDIVTTKDELEDFFLRCVQEDNNSRVT